MQNVTHLFGHLTFLQSPKDINQKIRVRIGKGSHRSDNIEELSEYKGLVIIQAIEKGGSEIQLII